MKICCMCSRLFLKTSRCRCAEAFGKTPNSRISFDAVVGVGENLEIFGQRENGWPDLPSQRRKRR